MVRAARVVAKARNELLSTVKRRGSSTTIQEATLRNLDAVLKSLPKDVMKALRLESLVEKGYRQGKSLLMEVAKDTEHETKISGFAGILDLRTYAQDTNQSVAQIKGLTEIAKEQIKQAAELSLALGEGETETMRRLFGDINKPGEKTPFRQVKISAERISRTVTNDLVNAGKLAAYTQYAEEFPELGILNEWVNVTDFRTSDVCMALVGQKRPPGQPFQGGGFTGTHPPSHPNCRSTIIPTIGEELEPQPVKNKEPKPTLNKTPQNSEGLSLEQRKNLGVNALKTVLTEAEFNNLQTLSRDFNPLAEKLFATSDKEEAGDIRSQLKAMREEVDSYVVRLIDAIKEAQSVNTRELRNNYRDPEEPIEWLDAKGEKHSIVLHESIDDHPQSYLVRDHLKTAISIYGGDVVEGTTFVYLDKYGGKSEGRNRGWADPENRVVNLGGKRGKELLGTMLHELAHFKELDTPNGRQASMEFIKSQATGEPVPLRDLTGINYGDSEVAYPDKFIDPYVGRLYPGPEPGTEVVSVGLQMLADPQLAAELALYNPAHFNYALSYMVEGLELPSTD